MIDIYKFERSKCKFTDDWYREIVHTDKYNYVGDFTSCEDSTVPEPVRPSIIISNCHSTYLPFLNKLKDKNINYGVIQQSDETLGDDFSFADHENCKFIARAYIHPHTRHIEKLFHLGLGYGIGYTKKFTYKNYNDREYTWGFLGSIRDTPQAVKHTNSGRSNAIALFEKITPNSTLHIGCGFTNPCSKPVVEYRAFMDNCKFALCPYGYTNNDTHRLYEALEAGCIPIVLKNSPLGPHCSPSYWHFVFRLQQEDNTFPFSILNKEGIEILQGTIEKIPFIIGDTWEDCLIQVEQIIKDNTGEQVQLQCKEFWNRWKKYWSSLFQKNIIKLLN
jgi:hypothetical protein